MTANIPPLLSYASRFFRHVSLAGVLLVASQHILETNRLLFEQLLNKGLPPCSTYLLGKCYSTNRDVADRFRRMGIYVSPDSWRYTSYRPFDEQHSRFCDRFLNYVRCSTQRERFRRVVVLDDGGELISRAQKVFHSRGRILGIEQTSAGYHRLARCPPGVPILNVARSPAKLKYESPEIAETFDNCLHKRLNKLGLVPQSALVIGRGPIGTEVARVMGRRVYTRLFDAIREGPEPAAHSLRDILPGFDLIIGATGERAVPLALHARLQRDAILASVSSSDREFDAVHIRRKLPRNTDCHCDIEADGLHLLNGGFPVNFDGAESSVPLEGIQITLALLYGAACIASRTRVSTGFVEVDDTFQEGLIRRFVALRGQRRP